MLKIGFKFVIIASSKLNCDAPDFPLFVYFFGPIMANRGLQPLPSHALNCDLTVESFPPMCPCLWVWSRNHIYPWCGWHMLHCAYVLYPPLKSVHQFFWWVVVDKEFTYSWIFPNTPTNQCTLQLHAPMHCMRMFKEGKLLHCIHIRPTHMSHYLQIMIHACTLNEWRQKSKGKLQN